MTVTRSIGAQVAAGFAVPVVALAIAVVAVVVGFAAMKSGKEDARTKAELRLRARDVSVQSTRMREAVARYALTQRSNAMTEYHDASQTSDDDLVYIVDRAATVAGAKDAAATLSGMSGAIQHRDALIVSAATRQRKAVLDAYAGVTSGAAAPVQQLLAQNASDEAQIDAAIQTLLKATNDAATVSDASFDQRMRTSELIVVAIAVAALVLSAIYAFGLVRGIRRRLGEVAKRLDAIVRDDFGRLAAALDRLAEGDLQIAFHSEREAMRDARRDEIAAVVQSHDALVDGLAAIGERLTLAAERLSDAIGRVARASRSVAIASDQTSSSAAQASVAVESIAQSVDRVADGSRDQAGKIAQASAAIEELARAATAIAEGANAQSNAIQEAATAIESLDGEITVLSQTGESLAEAARGAAGEAAAGEQAVEATQRAMRELGDVSQKAATAMLALEGRSSDVSAIVSTIEEIADQTNLLALNSLSVARWRRKRSRRSFRRFAARRSLQPRRCAAPARRWPRESASRNAAQPH